MTSKFPDVAAMLAPRSVAVIGASDRRGNLGGDTVDRLVRFGFPGPIWPINRSLESVGGLPAYASVADLPGIPDLVILAIPGEALGAAIRDCVAAGIRHGVAYAGGLAESGREPGITIQHELTALCRDAGFTLCGPNCVGFINTAVPVTATFSTALHEVEQLAPGAISVVTQSGGIGTVAMSIMLDAGFGLRMLISSGNEAVVSFADYIRALADDGGTRVIATYLEGVTDGPDLIAALCAARDRGKPVIMIKAGASPVAAIAAKAHTGALVGDDRVFDAMLQEAGVIRVQSIEELVDVALLLADIFPGRMPRGRGVGIVTFGGGNGVLATDQALQYHLTTPSLDAACVDRLRSLLVAVATAANPLDLTPTTAFRTEALAQLPAALDVFAAQSQIHSVMVIVGSLASRAREIIDVLQAFHHRSDKPVCIVWPSPPSGVVAEFARHGIPAFAEPARGMRALRHLAEHHEIASRPSRATPTAIPAFAWRSFVPERGPDAVVTEDRCHAILASAGLPVAPGMLARTRDDAATAAATLGFPLVLKAISPAVTHRAAAGLVAVDLRSAEEVADAFDALVARAAVLSIPLDGIYAQKMIKGGTELLVAAFRDPMFGTMISCGAGGALTELIDDVVTRQAPVDEAVAADMIARLRSYRDLRPGPDDATVHSAAAFVAAFSRLAASAPWTRFTFEVNPLKWSAEIAVAVDGLLIVEMD